MHIKHFYPLLALILVMHNFLYAQTPTIDSLKTVIEQKTGEADTYNQLAAQYQQLSAELEGKTDSVIFYAKKGLEKAGKKTPNQEAAYDALMLLSWGYQRLQKENSLNKSIAAADSAIAVAQTLSDTEKKFSATRQLVSIYYYSGQNMKALEHAKKLVQLNKKRETPDNPANYYNLIGVIQDLLGRADSSIHYYQKALENYDIREEKLQRAQTLVNIGGIYFEDVENNAKAMTFYKDANKHFKALYKEEPSAQIAANLAPSLLTLGQVYKEIDKLDTAMQYYHEALQLAEQYNLPRVEGDINSRIADIHVERQAYDSANTFYNKALELYQENNDQQGVASLYKNMGDLYFKQKEYREALEYTNKAIELFEQFNQLSDLMTSYQNLSKIQEASGDYRAALKNYKSYSALKDSTLTEQSMQQINELQTKYETKKKEREIKLQKARIEKQRTLTRSLIAVVLLVIVAAGFAIRAFIIKKRANEQLQLKNAEISQQKEEIETQRDEIEQQRDIVVKQKEEITDSIFYARRIQRALLPPDEYIQEHLNDYFILNKPRDIVSGDYYWLAEHKNKIYVTAADCTGHGVPGAFMSMLGISFLNEIMAQPHIQHADEVLERLREYVIKSLRQTPDAQSKDGMDMAFAIIDKTNMTMEYAGAYNSLYLIRNGELKEYKANRMPIGIYFSDLKPFKRHQIDLQYGDTIYMQSDGYVDQFGGDKGRKFMAKRYKKLLTDIAEKPMNQQREILDDTYEEWKSYREQVDDVLVVGIRISENTTDKAAT